MFRTLTIAALIALPIALVLLHLAAGKRLRAPESQDRRRFPRLESLSGIATAVSFVVLVLTGFYETLTSAGMMHGYPLMLHMAAGGAFAFFLIILILHRAESCWIGLHPSECENPPRFHPLQKFCFWVLVFLSLVLILTAVLAMYPLMGTGEQYLLLDLHRYAALGALVVAVIYVYLGFARRPVRVSASQGEAA